MATYFTSSNNQRDSTPMIYLPGSYPEATILSGNVMTYMNSGSYADSLAGSSHQQNNYIVQAVEASGSSPQQQEILSTVGGSRIEEHDFSTWRDGRNEMLAMQSMGDASSILHGGQNLQGQGLSLSLGTQIPSGIQMPSISYRNPNPGFASFLGPNSSVTGDGGDRIGSSRDEHPRSVEYLPHGFPAGNQDSNKEDLSQYGMMSIARTIPCSKYLKAAQQLLDEVVNVRKALNQPAKEKNQSVNENGMSKLKDSEGGSKNESSNPQESTNLPNELSHAERQELQNKLTKLLSMLDEVDRRYKQYYNQMQIVISSFDVIAGSGAAKPYTALALQTISRHFRCLRDAITGQIQAIRKSLGEQETSESSKGQGITRLRYVDQHLKQQRALHQLGMMQQHAWRPQRGLPESSVSILRAWLFEHFLHPYPKDSDKTMLARQTGLTRSQVSNWFINARVRLWKPMVEEMYKEETGDAELDSISSSENAAKQTTGDHRTSDDRMEEMQKTESSMPAERCRTEHLMDSKSENAADLKLTGVISRSNFDTGCRQEDLTDYGLLTLREEDQRPRVADLSVFPDAIVQSGVGAGDRFMAAAAAYQQMSDVGGFGSGNGVSLTLGLQHSEDGTLPISGTTHQGFVSMRGEDIFSASASSVGVESADFECINPENRQHHRFNSSHILHDFVA